MKDTRIALHTDFQIGQVDPRIFSGFLEHLGRSIYEGVYDPCSTHADEDGFRKDVLEALQRFADGFGFRHQMVSQMVDGVPGAVVGF